MIRVNGVDLRDLGFVARPRTLPRLGGERTVVQQIPGRLGGVRMGGAVQDDTLTVEGYIEAPSHATLLQRIDALTRLLQGRCVIQLTDYLDVEHPEIAGHTYDGPDLLIHLAADREWVGYLQQGPSRATSIGPAWITRAENVVLQWVLPNPTARSRIETTLTGSGALTLGTAPSPLRITIAGGITALTRAIVRVRAGGSSGLILRELQWDGSRAAGAALIIDAELCQVTVGGANAIDGFTAASDFPVADPAEGADYVEVTLTGGTGSTATIAYRRRWL